MFSQSLRNERIHSIIMAASVPEKKLSNLHDPVVITFQEIDSNESRDNKFSTCQFWVPEKKGMCTVYSLSL